VKFNSTRIKINKLKKSSQLVSNEDRNIGNICTVEKPFKNDSKIMSNSIKFVHKRRNKKYIFRLKINDWLFK